MEMRTSSLHSFGMTTNVIRLSWFYSHSFTTVESKTVENLSKERPHKLSKWETNPYRFLLGHPPFGEVFILSPVPVSRMEGGMED